MNDFHANMLAMLGPDDRRLTYPFNGRTFRLTDVGGDLNPVERLTTQGD